MRRLIVAAFSLGLSLAGAAGVATAQDKGIQGIITNADGSSVKSTAGLNPTANGGGGTIIYGDITTGPGYTVIGPPSVSNAPPPPEAAPVAAPEPAPEPAADTTETAVADTTETAVADTAVASETDLDADNYADALEPDLGLDPFNIDTDGDGAADGDELNIYGTDPTIFDSDGDGIGDGAELFDSRTDPLTFNDFSVESTAPVGEEIVDPAEAFTETNSSGGEELAQGTNEVLSATDGDAAAIGAGNASAAPGTVTRGGGALLGPDGTYNVTETAPSNVTIAGNTEVLAPPAAAPAETVAEPANDNASTGAGCGSYASWYDAQLAYEAAGATAADPGIVAALDPDYDGIVCEEGM